MSVIAIKETVINIFVSEIGISVSVKAILVSFIAIKETVINISVSEIGSIVSVKAISVSNIAITVSVINISVKEMSITVKVFHKKSGHFICRPLSYTVSICFSSALLIFCQRAGGSLKAPAGLCEYG